MSKKVVIIANFMRLPWESGNSRFPYIANLLDKRKFDVELITSSFLHSEKNQRKMKEENTSNLDYKITLLHEPGYKKNISLKRFYSHHVFAKNVEKYLEKIEKPDIIYCAIPSLDVGKAVAKFAKKNNIRFIIDVQDLWPEAFKMAFNVPVISDMFFYPMKKTADYIYEAADDIIAVSDTYAQRAANVNNKYKNKLSVFLGTELDYFDKCKKENEIICFDDVVRLVYIGTLGHSYDIKCVIDALKILKNKGIDKIKLIIMGNGPLEQDFEKYAKEREINCEFTGRLNYNEMVGKLCSCDIAINPIKSGSAGSIINKVGDYAAAGIPVINTQESEEYRNLVEEYNIGYNCENNNPKDLADKLEILYNDKKLRQKLGANNRRLAEEKFDRKNTYIKIKNLIEKE